LAEEVLHQDSAAARICQILAVDQSDGVNRHCLKLAAQQSDDRRDLGRHVACREIGGVQVGVFDAVVGTDDSHDPELKPCQPLADPLFGPLRIEAVPNLDGRTRRRSDALDEAHRVQTVLLDRLRKQLLFGVESHFIGAPGRGQHRDNDAHDRHNDNDADRHDQARLVPPRPPPFPGDVQTRRRQHAFILCVTGWLTLLGRKAFQSLAMRAHKRAERVVGSVPHAVVNQPLIVRRRAVVLAFAEVGRPRDADMGGTQCRRPAFAQVGKVGLPRLDAVEQFRIAGVAPQHH
jgi:hypothetical protein